MQFEIISKSVYAVCNPITVCNHESPGEEPLGAGAFTQSSDSVAFEECVGARKAAVAGTAGRGAGDVHVTHAAGLLSGVQRAAAEERGEAGLPAGERGWSGGGGGGGRKEKKRTCVRTRRRAADGCGFFFEL